MKGQEKYVLVYENSGELHVLSKARDCCHCTFITSINLIVRS